MYSARDQFNFIPNLPTYTWQNEVDYEIDIPLEYWQTGAELVPAEARDRFNQLNDFLSLFNGEYQKFGFNRPFYQNYFSITAMFIADTLMSYPPVIEGFDENFISPRFIQMLQEATHCVLADMIRFGTGLFQIVDSEVEAEVLTPLPIMWYPASDEADVLVNMLTENEIELYTNDKDGSVEYQRYRLEGSRLKEEIENNFNQLGSEAEWNVIQEAGLGRIGSIVPVQRRPSTGDWGRSLYRDITQTSLEINRRFEQCADILVEHGNPILLLIPTVGTPQYSDPASAEQVSLTIATEKQRFDVFRSSPVAALPQGYMDAKYLMWEGMLTDHYNMIDELQKQLFASTNIPAALYGLGVETNTPSGRALFIQYARTIFYTKQLQTSLIATLRKVILIAALYNGANASQLQTMADSIEIEWQNAVEQILEPQSVELTDEGAVVDEEEGDEDVVSDSPSGQQSDSEPPASD